VSGQLNLKSVLPELRELAIRAFREGDADGLIINATGNDKLQLVSQNVSALKERGIYEKCLLRAYVGCRMTISTSAPVDLFAAADRAKLRAAGDNLPGPGPFVLYRGIAGHGRARRPRGVSWTSSISIACWFAVRFDLPAPAVITTTVEHAEVLAYVNSRTEQEFIILPQTTQRVPVTRKTIQHLADQRRPEAPEQTKARLKLHFSKSNNI
jgi:hypothetical protein